MAQQTKSSDDELARALVFVTRGNNKTVRYILTIEDYLDLLRAVEYEGEPRDGVAWTLLQRFAFLYPTYKSLSTFIRAYVQPINPKWFPTGVKHKAWVKKLETAGKLAEAQDEIKRAARRVHYAKTPIEKISPTSKDVVETVFAIGKSPVLGAVHYRAPTIVAKSVEEATQARDKFGKENYLAKPVDYGNILKHNWFWSSSGSSGFRIQSVLAPHSAISKLVMMLIMVGGLGNLLFYTWKNYHG